MVPERGWLQPQARGSQHILAAHSENQLKAAAEAEGPSPAVQLGHGSPRLAAGGQQLTETPTCQQQLLSEPSLASSAAPAPAASSLPSTQA